MARQGGTGEGAMTGQAEGRAIAVANMKGGVGKTTTVIMLAEGFAAEGKSVVVVDLDAQANASYCFTADEALKLILDKRRSVTSFLADQIVYGDRRSILDYVTPEISEVTQAGELLSIALLASSPRLRLLEREIVIELAEKKYSLTAFEGRALRVLDTALKELRAAYDIVLFDCAPGISAFTEVAIRLADIVIVPTIPDYLSTLGFDAFRASIWENAHIRKSSLPPPKRPPIILPTRVNANKVQHKNTLEEMRAEAAEEKAPFGLFELTVANQAPIEKAMDPEYFEEPPTFVQKWGTAIDSVRALTRETRRWLDG